jgi:hypothetical protein
MDFTQASPSVTRHSVLALALALALAQKVPRPRWWLALPTSGAGYGVSSLDLEGLSNLT